MTLFLLDLRPIRASLVGRAAIWGGVEDRVQGGEESMGNWIVFPAAATRRVLQLVQ